ncbi:hypothetical protein GCM10023232_08780 [Sphingosinicella ginsenosidimutans]
MRRAWDQTEGAWRASPFHDERYAFEVAKAVMREVGERCERQPAWCIMVEIAMTAAAFLDLEDVEPFALDWPAIEGDASVAVAARQMMARRRRWAFEYDQMLGIVRRQLVDAFLMLIRAMPESCFDTDDEGAFTVPLVSLLDRPAEVVERLMVFLYDNGALQHELFHYARERLATNLLVASGLPPSANPREHADRLVMPTRKKSATPTELADLYLAGTPFADLLALPVPFHIPASARFEHCHIVGGTGHGKTQLMQRMIHADLVAARNDGRSVVVIDSQGDLINKLVRLDLFAPDERGSLADRLVLIDPSDVEYPASLNLFDAPLSRTAAYGPADRERVLNGVVELYESFFGALLGAELTQKQGVIFRYLARLMLAIPGATIGTLMQLMEDGRAYRSQMESLPGSARRFFETEFFHPSFAATKKQILKRLWGVLSTPAFERMFAQRHNKLDLFTATNDGKIILINTAKDLLKTEGSALFGRFFVSMLAQAALERSTIPESRRTPTFVYVDEAQEYFDDTVETILSQGRKYGVGITLAHQSLDQLSPRLKAAFLSNTSLKCAGGVSAKDARALSSELHTTPEFIEGMRRRSDRTEFAVWLKNRTPEALNLTVPLGFLERQPTLSEEAYDELIERNRERYCGRMEDMVEELPPAAAMLAIESREPSPAAPEIPADREAERPPPLARPSPASSPSRKLGKGGPKHRYLQSLVKELGEQQGFRATIEAPLPGGGQIDVLLEQGETAVPVEISVTTPAEYECGNIRKCLAAGFPRVAFVLAKSKATHGRFQSALLAGLTPEEQARVAILAPEDIPDYIAALSPAPAPSESVVKGWKVRVSRTSVSPEDAKERRDRLAKIVARSLSRGD